MIKHFNIKIIGQIQGVGFRLHARNIAESLRLAGFAKNEADGSVYIEAEGEEEHLDEFIRWCRIGSPRAQVKKVTISPSEIKNYQDFSIE